MSWTGSIWPEIGLRYQQHAVDLHAAFNERYKAKNDGSAWPSLRGTTSAVGALCGVAEKEVYDAIDAQLTDDSRWNDTSVTITDQTDTDDCILYPDGLPIAFGIADADSYYGWLNEMTMEHLNVSLNWSGSGGRVIQNGWANNIGDLDFLANIGWDDADWADVVSRISTYASSGFPNVGTSSDFSYHMVALMAHRFIAVARDTSFERWTLEAGIANTEIEVEEVWTGKTSRIKAYALFPVLEGHVLPAVTGEGSEFHAQGAGISPTIGYVNEIMDEGSDDNTSPRILPRLINETDPDATFAWYYDASDVDTSGATEEAFVWGWAIYERQAFVTIDWSVTGGFDYT